MQAELATEQPELQVDIVVVNYTGLESGNADLFAATLLPVVQDDATANVWASWGATWRDVYVLDRTNAVLAVYNLTTYDLSDPVNYQALQDIFVAAGAE